MRKKFGVYLLISAACTLSSLPSFAMEDYDESKINHIRTRNLCKKEIYKNKIKIYQDKIKELDELEILFQNLSINKSQGSETLPKPDFSFSAPSLPKELRGASSKRLETYDGEDHLSSDEESITSPTPKTPDFNIKDKNPFGHQNVTPPPVKKYDEICVSPNHQENIATVRKIMTDKLASYTQAEVIGIVAPHVNVGTNSTNYYRSILNGSRGDSPPHTCIENYLKWKSKNKK